MCGIFCIITSKNDKIVKCEELPEWTRCKDVILARGPDCFGSIEYFTDPWKAYFCASVLWMQGSKPIQQPLVDIDSNKLLWNGDNFSGSLFKENICDSEIVLEALKSSNNIPSTLQEIKGPFSFIYFKKALKLLYFARDRYGRHSLLINFNEECDTILLTSVAVKSVNNIVELPAIGIFVADLNSTKIQIKCIPWFEPNERFFNILNDLENKLKTKISILESDYFPKIEGLSSGIITNNSAGFLKYVTELKNKSMSEVLDYLLEKENIKQIVDNLLTLLNESVKRRVKIIPNFCKNCTGKTHENFYYCPHAKVGLLFSGGLDSAILAVIAHNYINLDEEIDLINVAFEKNKNSNYEVPDRITGKKTFLELLKICPKRKFNFIEVNITQEELEKYRSNKISNLVYPLATILDDSLACAVWFASRGKGILNPEKEFYESSCRVLLLGMGADEQFGGYMRHRNILKRKGWEALTEELRLDFDRIAERNLGRDDRMVADHGRQSRLPYLDEDLVTFIQKLPPWERCCPIEEFPPGLGEKLLLRLLARKIKLKEAATFPKRAFQFGSRIADGKENAKHLSKRL